MSPDSHILNKQGERLDVSFHQASHLEVLVVLGHGVTGNKDRPLLVAIAEGLAKKGWPCLRFSFSGNGNSEGAFEDSNISKEVGDLLSILETVPQEKRIAYIGHSMGAAVGLRTASHSLAIHCLISLAGMVQTADFVKREFGDVTPGNGFMWGEENCPLSEAFVNDLKDIDQLLDDAARVCCPWLLIHGSEDDVVPIEDSRRAFEIARCDKKLIEIPEAGHSFDTETYSVLVDRIDFWLKKCFR